MRLRHSYFPPVFSLVALLGTLPLLAEEVILDYRATVQTVSRTPFGLSIPRLTKVIGVFVYDPASATDQRIGDPQRGIYTVTAGAAFDARFLDHRVTGSATPELQVEDIQVGGPGRSIDTFRYVDGERFLNPPGIMALDGVADPGIRLALAITDSEGSAFVGDELPTIFPLVMPGPFPEFPHTFSLGDNEGTMLLQFGFLAQRRPNTLQLVDVRLGEDGAFVLFHSRPEKAYDILFSTDLLHWQEIETGYQSEGYLTAYADSGLVSRIQPFPGKAFYRIRENP